MHTHTHQQLIKLEILTDPASRHQAEAIFNISHDNGKSTVEQLMVLSQSRFTEKWTARMTLSDMKDQDSPQEAAEKLADWLERLAVSIRNREEGYNIIDLNKDLATC